MRCVARLVGIVCVSSALVALPSWAVAQHTIAGRLVEELPGGTPLPLPGVFYDLVAADGSTTFLGSVNHCVGTETANCIGTDGAFNITGLSAGTYQLSVEDGIAPVLDKVISVSVSANVDVGSISLIRTPFTVDVTVGAISPVGGLVPVSVRVRTTWNIPTLPIVAKIEERQPRPQTGTLGRMSHRWSALSGRLGSRILGLSACRR